MKKDTKLFIYFVLVAPLLTKLVEWAFQWVTYGGWSHLSHGVWLMQLIFIEFLALIIYAVMNHFGKYEGTNLIYIPAFAYLLKELYNFFFVYSMKISWGTGIAIFVEPVMMLFIVGYVPYMIFFGKKNKRRKK